MKMKASGSNRNREGVLIFAPRSIRLLLVVFMVMLLVKNVEVLQRTYLTDRHLNFIVFDQPPFDTLTRGPNGTFTWTGSDLHLIEWLAAKLNFTFSLVLINQTIADEYGTHEGLFYQLINEKDIDGLACSFYLTMDRVARMDYSFFTWVDGFSLVVPRPGEESRLFAFIGPFQPIVWLSILISILVVVGMMTVFTCIYQRNAKHALTPSKSDPESNNQPKRDDEICSVYHERGSSEASSLLSFRVLTGIWVLCATVLVNSYTGIVISSLTKPKMKPTIDSFEDLAASTEVSIVLRHDTAMGDHILKATSGVYKVLGDQARSSPGRIVGDPFKLNALLETGQFAYPFLSTFGYYFVGSRYKKEGKCRFKTSKTLSASTGYYSFLFKKGSSLTPAMSRALMDLFESSLLRHWVYTLPTIPRAEKCFSDSKSRVSGQVPIQLIDLTSAFLILGIGTGFGIFSFLLEHLYSNYNKHKHGKLEPIRRKKQCLVP